MNTPHIIVLTPDTQIVVDNYKALMEKFSKKTAASGDIEVRLQKLFSKHISIEEHQKLLSAEPKNAGKKFLNVYIGVPNRVKKLIELGTIKVKGRNFKCLVIDTHVNPKSYSIFDILETRDDTYDILMLAQKRFIKRKLQVMLV
jgi:hypothetical protein